MNARTAPLLLLCTALCAGSCTRRHGAISGDAASVVDRALDPAQLSQTIQKTAGGHIKSTLKMAVGRPDQPMDAVTTNTDLILDKSGQYRMSEQNDRDGGRDVVLHGHELYVALRYGKMIRRRAEGAEPARLLHEGLGATWAAWELVRGAAALSPAGPAGAGKLNLKVGLAEQPRQSAHAAGAVAAWRDTAVIDSLEGTLVVDEQAGLLRQADLKATFHAVRNGGEQIRGEVEAHASLTPLAATDVVQPPDGAEDLTFRQRTLPEQKALLSGAKPDEPAKAP